MKRFFTFMLLLCFLCSAAAGEVLYVSSPEEMPEPNADGFLDEAGVAFAYASHTSGLWLYIDADTRLEIQRHQTKSPLLTWYTAEIYCRRGTGLYTRPWNESRPGRTNGLPQEIALRDQVVYAQSGDFYSYRVSHDKYPGVILRDGKILYKKTYSKYVHATPNLATLGLWASGRGEVHECYEMSAADYQKAGAENVLAFGPILLKNGEIQDLSDKAYRYSEPRSCMGIVEDGHYVGLLVEGRKAHSEGADLQTCARILQDMGCMDAINLDGGNTSAMLFLGSSVQLSERGGEDVNDRTIPDILCAGKLP